MNLIICVLCFIQFLMNISTALFAPFLPTEARSKGVDTIYVGILMGTYGAMYIFSCFMALKVLKIIGRRIALAIGFFLLIC